jgi:16S rRNA (cytosine967-C5)-methyltransferase
MREELYELVRSFISRYYTLKYIVLSSGRRPSYKLLARLFLYIYHNEGGLNPRSIVEKTNLGNLLEIIESLEFAELHVKYSLPEWFYKRLAFLLPRSDLVNLLSSMNKRVLWLRINTLKVDVDKALKNLEKWARVEVDPDIPYLVKVLASKRPIRSLDLVKNGEVIPQDKASVLAVEALKPDPGSVVYDFAAGPGY